VVPCALASATTLSVSSSFTYSGFPGSLAKLKDAVCPPAKAHPTSVSPSVANFVSLWYLDVETCCHILLKSCCFHEFDRRMSYFQAKEGC